MVHRLRASDTVAAENVMGYGVGSGHGRCRPSRGYRLTQEVNLGGDLIFPLSSPSASPAFSAQSGRARDWAGLVGSTEELKDRLQARKLALGRRPVDLGTVVLVVPHELVEHDTAKELDDPAHARNDTEDPGHEFALD